MIYDDPVPQVHSSSTAFDLNDLSGGFGIKYNTAESVDFAREFELYALQDRVAHLEENLSVAQAVIAQQHEAFSEICSLMRVLIYKILSGEHAEKLAGLEARCNMLDRVNILQDEEHIQLRETLSWLQTANSRRETSPTETTAKAGAEREQ